MRCFSSRRSFSEVAKSNSPCSWASWSGRNLESVGGNFCFRRSELLFKLTANFVKLYYHSLLEGEGLGSKILIVSPVSSFNAWTDSFHLPDITQHLVDPLATGSLPDTEYLIFLFHPDFAKLITSSLTSSNSNEPLTSLGSWYLMTISPICSTYIVPIIIFYTKVDGLDAVYIPVWFPNFTCVRPRGVASKLAPQKLDFILVFSQSLYLLEVLSA